MWILECDGDILQGKKIWLRPGKSYLFGRTSPEGGRYAGFKITDKTVSRKHLTVSVAKVSPGQSTQPETRSELSLEDMGAKTGTVIDGVRIQGEKKVLTTGNEHTFKLGGYTFLFRIKWKPVVLTFTFPSKDTKGGKDPLIPIRSRLEDLDVKMVIPYLFDKTTHVVAGKRNTAKCLQALINAKFIVDRKFLDAVVYAATPADLDQPESLSPLELDFDAHWPDPINYLPAPGKEPGQRSTELFKPDPARADIFERFTFIFFDEKQFENLQSPITNGGGKALFYTIQNEKTTPDEVVEYVNDVTSEHNSEESKIILIQFPGDDGYTEWAINLQLKIQMTLGREFIQQNEFLDAILTNNPSALQRKVAGFVRRMPTSSKPEAQETAQAKQDENQAEPTSQPAARRGRRVAVKSAFSGFDDGFDPAEVTSYKRSASTSSTGHRLPPSNQAANHPDTIIEDATEGGVPTTPPNNLKRAADEQLHGEDNLPAWAALKRRRLQQDPSPDSRTKSTSPKNQTIKKPSKKKEPIDLTEAMANRRKKYDAARTDPDNEEPIAETMANMSFADMQALAQIETLPAPPAREPGNQGGRTTPSAADRWNPAWNGRKNFKGFRRQGDSSQARRRGQSIIVALEPVGKNGRPLNPAPTVTASTASSSTVTSQTREDRPAAAHRRAVSRRELSLREDASEDRSRSQSFASARSTQPQPVADSHQVVVVEEEEEEVSSELQVGQGKEVGDVNEQRKTRRAGEDRKDVVEQRMNKRGPPPSAESGRETRKKAKLVAEGDESESEDDDDGTRFRFRKRRRG